MRRNVVEQEPFKPAAAGLAVAMTAIVITRSGLDDEGQAEMQQVRHCKIVAGPVQCASA